MTISALKFFDFKIWSGDLNIASNFSFPFKGSYRNLNCKRLSAFAPSIS